MCVVRCNDCTSRKANCRYNGNFARGSIYRLRDILDQFEAHVTAKRGKLQFARENSVEPVNAMSAIKLDVSSSVLQFLISVISLFCALAIREAVIANVVMLLQYINETFV